MLNSYILVSTEFEPGLLLFKGKDSNVLTAVNIKSTNPFRFAHQRCIRHLVYLPAELVVCVSVLKLVLNNSELVHYFIHSVFNCPLFFSENMSLTNDSEFYVYR